jgi:hypothetical protein
MSGGGNGLSHRLRRFFRNPTPRFDSVRQLDVFLISAIVMVLVIRTQLWLTNYPQLGGGDLHIAHLLWGGLFMLIAIWLALIYVNRWSRRAAAVIGGIGFGFFIDELGKFITEDNDYFFQPAAPLIYLVFITLFLVIRTVARHQKPGPDIALANALDLLPSTVTGEFGHDEQLAADQLLDQADPKDPRVIAVRQYLATVQVQPRPDPSRLGLWWDRMKLRLTEITRAGWFEPAVVTVLIVWAFFSLLGVIELQLNLFDLEGREKPIPGTAGELVGWGRALSMLASVAFVGLGTWRMLRKHHQAAYRAYTTALLISIFITRVFSFLEIQFTAVFGLAIDILMLAAIAALSSRDEQEREIFLGRAGHEAEPEVSGGSQEAR